MSETRHTARNILIMVNAVIASGAVILKIIDPIVVRYTKEIRAADLFNFVVFTPMIMVVLTFLLHRLLRPIVRLAPLVENLNPAQAQELRTAAFNLPVKVLVLFNVIILSGVGLVALGFDAVFYPFYPLYKRVISMGLIWAYTVCSSLAVYVYVKRRMVPILRRTSGRAADIGRRATIKSGMVATTLTLTAMVLLFLSAYGYSKTREALIRDKDAAAETLLDRARRKTASFRDLASLKKQMAPQWAREGVYLVDASGDPIPGLPEAALRPAMTFEKSDSTMMKLLPLAVPFNKYSLVTYYRIEPHELEVMQGTTVFFTVAGIFFLLFSGIISYSVASETSSSITDISDRMRKISENRETLYSEFEVVSLDEVGDLTRSFNSLQRAIYRQALQIKDLEERKHLFEKGQLRQAVDKATASLQESEMQFRTLAETTTAGIFIHREGKLVYGNPAGEIISGYPSPELLTREFADLFHPDDRALARQMGRVTVTGKRLPRGRECRIVTKGGETRWVSVAAGVMDYEGKPAVIATVFDITDRRRAEEEKSKLYEERIAEEKRHVMEKENILMDLHDGIGGITTNISILSELGQNAPDPGSTKETLSTISRLSREGLAEIRSFMQSLDTRELHWRTMAAELRNQGAKMMEPHGIAFSLELFLDDLQDQPESLLWINALKIYKEALTNIIKHAKATAVVVTLFLKADVLRLTVQDNGIGCEQGSCTGRGLSNMKKRAEEICGTVAVSSDKGTRVHLEVPLPVMFPPR